MSKKRPPETSQAKTYEQAERDCDWIALNGWDWWRTVVADADRLKIASEVLHENASDISF